jgi:NAD(P)-dependent dehydrogenase (short-subunit alcohol dehydrogenase family)
MSLELFSCKDKVALVIGGGGHICSKLAEGLVAAGAFVVVADLRIQKAEAICQAINSRFPQSSVPLLVDATRLESLSGLLAQILDIRNRIDVVINGAGINSPKPFLEITENEWHEVVDSQLTATFFGCQIFGRHMINNGKGSIINVSSASADPALSKAFAYSAAKSGIKNLTQNLGREWGRQGVRVNAIRPGFFPTEWNRKNFITPERERSILNHTPMHRFGEPEELIGAAVFLASDASSFVTGSELVVDGGFSAMSI